MTTILHIDSSIHYEDSISRKLTARIMDKLKAQHPNATVLYKDLTKNPIPHIDPDFIAAVFQGANNEALKRSDALTAELMSADIIVIGAPMYNFNIASQLKSWLDNVCRAHKTFRYTEKGPEGLLTGKKTFVGVSTGGIYSEGPMANHDHVRPYIKQILAFMGITDVQIAFAEKQGMGVEMATSSLNSAYGTIDSWF